MLPWVTRPHAYICTNVVAALSGGSIRSGMASCKDILPRDRRPEHPLRRYSGGPFEAENARSTSNALVEVLSAAADKG
jgi:hypothetical protein